ncbi:MAG: hypothetical protein ABIA04_12495 [Pseudomonadota bacterium]
MSLNFFKKIFFLVLAILILPAFLFGRPAGEIYPVAEGVTPDPFNEMVHDYIDTVTSNGYLISSKTMTFFKENYFNDRITLNGLLDNIIVNADERRLELDQIMLEVTGSSDAKILIELDDLGWFDERAELKKEKRYTNTYRLYLRSFPADDSNPFQAVTKEEVQVAIEDYFNKKHKRQFFEEKLEQGLESLACRIKLDTNIIEDLAKKDLLEKADFYTDKVISTGTDICNSVEHLAGSIRELKGKEIITILSLAHGQLTDFAQVKFRDAFGPSDKYILELAVLNLEEDGLSLIDYSQTDIDRSAQSFIRVSQEVQDSLQKTSPATNRGLPY